MTRKVEQQTKVHYKGETDDFIIFVDDVKTANDWKTDKTIPLAQVISTFKIFVTHRHGAQGSLDSASKFTLENEFGPLKEEEMIRQILEKGSIQETEQASDKFRSKNDSIGTRFGH